MLSFCVLPLIPSYASVIAGVSVNRARREPGLLAAFCAGLAIPFLVAALPPDRFLAWSTRMRRSWLPVAERVSGAMVLGVGLLLVTGVLSRMASWLAT